MQINFFNIARGAILGALAFTSGDQDLNKSDYNKNFSSDNDHISDFMERLHSSSSKIKKNKPLDKSEVTMLSSFRKENRSRLISAHNKMPVYSFNNPVMKDGKLSYEPASDEEIFTIKVDSLRKNYKNGITSKILIETFGEIFIREQASNIYHQHKSDTSHVNRLLSENTSDQSRKI